MDETTKIVKDFYDNSVQVEWARIKNRPEFLLTCRYFDRYIQAGDRVLDIGGGPGRYSMYLAQKGCDVTLLDLSDENIQHAREKAQEQNLKILALAGDAREAEHHCDGLYDHVLLMGPLYHLLEERDRVQAVNSALGLLKPGGKLFVSFINVFAGMIFAMKEAPEIVIDVTEQDFYKAVLAEKSFAGQAFTQAFFINQKEVLPFMAQFPLEKLHLFGQESITSPCEGNILSQSPEVVAKWLDLAEQLAEREDLLSWSEHLMYVGRKKEPAES